MKDFNSYSACRQDVLNLSTQESDQTDGDERTAGVSSDPRRQPGRGRGGREVRDGVRNIGEEEKRHMGGVDV